jgi:hypothetical protein
MAWQLEYVTAAGIIEVVFTGKTSGADLRELTSRAIALSADHTVALFLVDTTEIELTASILDLLDLPSSQYAAEGLRPGAQLALVLPKREKEKRDARFYETACLNRGWRVKSFASRREAMEWLTGGE